MKKYVVLIILLQIILISCAKIEIISDPYWNTFIADFDGNAFGLRLQALLNGNHLDIINTDISEGLPDINDIIEIRSDVYLFSPLFSKTIVNSDVVTESAVFYYFDWSNQFNVEESNDNMVVIKRDRRKAFFDAGALVTKEIMDAPFISLVYDVENPIYQEEAEKFLDGIKENSENIRIESLVIKSDTSASEVRSFFDRKNVINYPYIAIFTDKWKSICYELSEKDAKLIITSDSWLYKTYDSSIVFSIEDDIKGMLKKIYNNIKTGKHADISLDGVINR